MTHTPKCVRKAPKGCKNEGREMTKPGFLKIYPDLVTQQACEGYYDGRRKDSPEPGPNRHPAYIHGFRNGRDDMRGRPSRTAQEIREAIAYIEATEAI